MAEGRIKNTELSAIAAAIRSKNGESTVYKPGEMAQAILDIPAGTTPTGTVNITQNGTTDVTQYASAAVNVPNSYAAADEGKVVRNGALVAQTARSSAITQNGTYDTTTNNEVTVNVSGGGSGATILSGTRDPSAAQGSDGAVYLKYVDHSSGYTRVEYIKNSAQGAYINTGYVFKANSIIEIDCNESSGSTYPSPFGCRTNTSGSGQNQWYFSPSGTSVYYAMGNNERNTANVWSYNARHKIIAKAGVALIDGIPIYTNAQAGVGTLPLYLFAVNLNSSPWGSTWAVMKLFSCKIYEGDSLVMNLIPAKNSSDVVGLYDTESDTFYVNDGSGTFSAGPAFSGNSILSSHLKVNGAWQNLIGSDINDVGGVS